jgi:lipid-A-disaccharide synthase
LSRSILVVAGEISGDMHAAAVMRALRERDPKVEVFGIGGDALQEAGAEILHHVRDMAVFGPFAVLQKYPHFRRVFEEMVEVAAERRPAAALLVDYGGFNLRFAGELKRLGIKVLYYVSPQVWASRPGRIRKMAEVVDRLMVIFPFEPEVYRDTGLRVDFVGHPLVDEAAALEAAPPADLPWPGDLRIALLPGSRKQEVRRLLPVMLDAAERLHADRPDAGFLVAAPSHDFAVAAAAALDQWASLPCRVVACETRQILAQARAAWVTSGTATVEAALMRCPMAVVYRTSPLVYLLGRMVVRVPYIGMVNLLAGRELCPELIQGAATSGTLARALTPLLADTAERRAMVAGLEEVASALGTGGAADNVADIVWQETG